MCLFQQTLIRRYPISINLVIPHRIAVLAAFVPGIPLYGVNPAIFYPLHDTHVVSGAVLRPGEPAWGVIAIGNPTLLLSS